MCDKPGCLELDKEPRQMVEPYLLTDHTQPVYGRV